MAKPLPASDLRNGAAGPLLRSPSNGATPEVKQPAAVPKQRTDGPNVSEVDLLQAENEQLRALCTELEQALQEAAQQGDQNPEDRFKEYESLLDEKSETIRELHQQLQDAQKTIAELESENASKPRVTGPTPREEELLNLSEDLERERRQLQEDEQALMEQMREMEISMARERAEMARQRNDLQRVQGEVRHELERLERSGALQSKIDGLKSKLHDATTRRGMANSAGGPKAPPAQQSQSQSSPPPLPDTPPKEKGGLLGRLFGGGK
jgi:hypothetical protein